MRRDAFWPYCCYVLARAIWRLGDVDRATYLYDEMLPLASHNATLANIGWGSMQTALGWCAAAVGRLDDAEVHYEAALSSYERNGWITPQAETQASFAALLVQRGGPGDRERAVALLDAALETAVGVGLTRVRSDVEEVRDRLLGRSTAAAALRPARTRFERARGKLTVRGRAAVVRWTRGLSDEELLRRFGPHMAQRALFAGLTRAFQPALADGFDGDLVFELSPPDDELDPAAADWWTIEVRGRKASARRGTSDRPAALIRVGIADFVRMGAGELHPIEMITTNRVQVEGDVFLAARIPEIFGVVAPLDA
jgi:hypothetical protein